MTSPDLSLNLLGPEAIVVAAAFFVLTLDLTVLRQKPALFRARAAALAACVGCAAAMLWLVLLPACGSSATLALTPMTQFLKLILLALSIFTAVISLNARFTRHVGEFFALLLLATAGLMLLISSDNLLMIFLALELLSLPLYALAAFDKTSLPSAEAALKYFLFGGISAAFTLFGISLIYGITGQIQLAAIVPVLQAQPAEPVFYAALVMTLIGLAFKLAAAPFHFWAPDVYQGAPTPVASFIASASKVGAFFVLARILLTGFWPGRGGAALGGFAPGWMPVLAAISVLSMVAGNLAALVQTSLKRLLAYSAIAHAGFALLAFFGTAPRARPSLLFYVITYALTVVGAFAVVAAVETAGGRDRLADFAGLSRRAPLLSFCMLVFMLSLAGIPPLSGFFAKFYVFVAAAAGAPNLGLLWLVIVAVAASAVSLYYYLQVVKQIYAAEPPPGLLQRPALSAQLAIALLAAAVIALGCAPSLLLSKLSTALQFSAF